LLDSLASRISVELTVEGSRFPRLLCSVRVLLSHRWFCPCCMQHAAWSESATAAVEKRLPTNCVMGPVEPWNAFSRTFLHVSTELSL
jgi:acetolactate synthase regulatory subunit